MKKIVIGGQRYIRERELREHIRYLRKNVDTNYSRFDKDHRAMVHLAYNDIVRFLYQEELKNAKTPDEIRAIHEMPGDFMVIRSNGDKTYAAFVGWNHGDPIFGSLGEGMVFDYESMAQGIAEELGDGWEVFDASHEAADRYKKLLNALFSGGDDE